MKQAAVKRSGAGGRSDPYIYMVIVLLLLPIYITILVILRQIYAMFKFLYHFIIIYVSVLVAASIMGAVH